MTRIVLLPSAYLPSLGGVQELTRHLARHLQDSGDEVEVWSTTNDDPSGVRTDVMDRVRVRRFSLPLPSASLRAGIGSLTGGLGALREMLRAHREFQPDLMHIQCFGPNGIYATALSMLTGTPLVVSLQGETRMDDTDIFDTSSTLRMGLRAGLRRAVAVTGCSAFTLLDAEHRFGLKPGAGRVVFNGVAQDVKSSAAGGGGSTPYILAVGRVVEKKGFDLLIGAWASICAAYPEVVLIIAGDGPQLPELRRLAESLGVADRIRFHGRASREEVAALMSAAEAFVMPSRLEPFGIVILEAWQAGTPVVCSSRGGPPEFVDDGRTGMLVDPFDRAALATAIDRLLASPDLRNSLSDSASVRVRDFRWTEITEQYRQIYSSVERNSLTKGRKPSVKGTVGLTVKQ